MYFSYGQLCCTAQITEFLCGPGGGWGRGVWLNVVCCLICVCVSVFCMNYKIQKKCIAKIK